MQPQDEPLSSEDDLAQTRLEREEGVFRKAEGGRESGCEPEEEECAPSDFSQAPFDDDGTPGTPDDLPYTLGEDSLPASDAQIGEGSLPALRVSEEESEDAAYEDRESRRQANRLASQDEEIGVGLEPVGEAEGERILDALGDDAAEPLPDFPEGTSATGAGGGPDHGGFPERR